MYRYFVNFQTLSQRSKKKTNKTPTRHSTHSIFRISVLNLPQNETFEDVK